jgi:hypothetical protein
MSHTKEPWIINRYGAKWAIETEVTSIADVFWCNTGNGSLNAQRIVACVNACRDIPQEILEQPDYSIKAELDSLDEQIQKRMKAEDRVKELEAFIRTESDDLRDAGYSVDADRFIEFINNKTLANNKGVSYE